MRSVLWVVSVGPVLCHASKWIVQSGGEPERSNGIIKRVFLLDWRRQSSSFLVPSG